LPQRGGALLAAGLLLTGPVARAGVADELISQINAYRAAPAPCEGRAFDPVAPLSPHPALSNVRIGTGTFLEPALERLGFYPARADAISILGAGDVKTAMDSIRQRYCRALLSTEYSAIGVLRRGDDWQIVLAQPVAPLTLPPWPEAGREILAAVNAARAQPRLCGERGFGAAGPLVWNERLGETALGHSSDMAAKKYFAHKARDGSMVGERALRAGYAWRAVGENIAAGQTTAAEAVAGWLSSPGHCANIMHPGFTDMGGAYAIRTERQPGRVYWTQVFATPR
jgi:uncharacterized protein YkwD